jgi:hypothetical protein
MTGQKSGDTSHLYDGKTVRSAAPSRKKLAGTMSGSTSDIPKDAIPEVEVPTFIESLLGGPLVPKMKFLPADKMVQNLQLGCYGVLIALGILTYIVTPAVGTIWFAVTGSITAANIMQLLIVIGAVGTGFWGVMGRDARYLLTSYVLFILSVLRFASSKVSLSQDLFGFADNDFLLTILVVVYAVLLVMFFELSNGVLRFSMLDTSIRTREVYVMNVKKIVSKYHRSLVINPLIAGVLAMLVLSANSILPAFVGLFSEQTALRMEESVELISVYGVALGTLVVFLIVGGLFALDLPTHLQSWRENKD